MIYSKEDARLLEKSEYFDKEWYCARYPQSAANPAEHYLTIGWMAGKNPGPRFNGTAYNQELVAFSGNPLLHYEKYGRKNKRSVMAPKSITVKLYDIEYKKDGVCIALSAVEGEEIFISIGGTIYRPLTQYPFHHQECFDSYLKSSGETLILFKVPASEMKKRVFVFSGDETQVVNLTIQNFVNMYQNAKSGKYIMLTEDSFVIGTKKQFMKFAMQKVAGNPNERAFLRDIVKPRKKKYNLYFETLDNHNDNAYKMFLADLEHNENAYFVTSKIAYENETNAFLKSHYIVMNSQEHKDYVLQAKKLIVSWWCFPIYGYARSVYTYPFLNYDFIFVPHGISCDKNSYYLHYYNFGRLEGLYCCSEFEKQYFEECNGIDNVKVLGYPRMDKWYEAKINENMVLLFPTWRKNVQDAYLSEIYSICENLTAQYPKLRIVYAAHPSIREDVYQQIQERTRKISKRITCISPLDNLLFNQYFGEAKYLITDYSSVAYDFSYKKDGIAIYYKPLADVDSQYELRPVFYEVNCGVTVENLQDLADVLRGKFNEELITQRKNAFFPYRDNRNTERVLSAIIK